MTAQRFMDEELNEFFAPLDFCVDEVLEWPIGKLRVRTYLTDDVPPVRYVSSARAVITDGDQVLIVEDPIRTHILPGGRLEAGESPEEALAREVLEETGWSLCSAKPIGILHYRLLGSLPDGWRRPYPDFLQIVYAGIPGSFRPELKEEDGYELDSKFIVIEEARRLPLRAGQQALLDAALMAISKCVRLGGAQETVS